MVGILANWKKKILPGNNSYCIAHKNPRKLKEWLSLNSGGNINLTKHTKHKQTTLINSLPKSLRKEKW